MNARDLYNELDCIATSHGFNGLRGLIEQSNVEMGRSEGRQFYCWPCNVWLANPERNDAGEPICEAGHRMSENPF